MIMQQCVHFWVGMLIAHKKSSIVSVYSRGLERTIFGVMMSLTSKEWECRHIESGFTEGRKLWNCNSGHVLFFGPCPSKKPMVPSESWCF